MRLGNGAHDGDGSGGGRDVKSRLLSCTKRRLLVLIGWKLPCTIGTSN
jgi:hypothetical protein